MKNTILLSLIIVLFASCSPKTVAGLYRTNFSTYGRFGKALTLRCDSTFTLDSSREFKNISSSGNWEVKNDSLVLNFRTVKYPKIEDGGTNYYHIKRNKLISVFPISKAEYLDLITKIEDKGLKDSLKLGSYRKFKRNRGRTFKNFYGKMGKQFFKKVEKIECGN